MNTPHAFLRLDGEPGWKVFDLTDASEAQALLDEIADQGHDWSDSEDPLWYVEVFGKPAGYSKTLPEHPGW